MNSWFACLVWSLLVLGAGAAFWPPSWDRTFKAGMREAAIILGGLVAILLPWAVRGFLLWT